MSNEATRKLGQALEGEGSYSATRRYKEHLAEAIDSGDIEAAAEAAREAMEGAERESLERAAATAKRGPRALSTPATTRRGPASPKPKSPKPKG